MVQEFSVSVSVTVYGSIPTRGDSNALIFFVIETRQMRSVESPTVHAMSRNPDSGERSVSSLVSVYLPCYVWDVS